MNRSCSRSNSFDATRLRHAASLLLTFVLFSTAFEARAADDSGKLVKQANRALREWRFADAENLYREALAENNDHAEARLNLSFALIKQRKLQDAYEHASRVLALEPRRARAHALLGTTLMTIGDFPRATRSFYDALALDSEEALAIAGLAMIDFYENRVDAAYAKLDRAVFLEPNDPDYLFSFAQTAARSERYRQAADAYERFLKVAPRTDEDRRARIRGLIQFLRFVSTQGKLYEVAGTGHAATEFELVNNRPVIKVRVNNRIEPLRFVLDTGSSMCVMSEDAARRVGVQAVARGGLARAVGGPGRFEIVYGFLQELAIGGVRSRNVPIYIRPFFNQQQPVDGYIGLSVITRYLTEVDYQNRLLTLTRFNRNEPTAPATATEVVPGTTPPTAEFYELPARLTTGGFWSGEVKIDGVERPQSFIIDTGASISVVSAELAAREELSRFKQSTQLRIHGAAGVTENVPLLLLPGVALGAHARANVPAVVLDMESINESSGFEQTGILGGNVLRHFRVAFNFERMIVRLTPNKARRAVQPSNVSRADVPGGTR